MATKFTKKDLLEIIFEIGTQDYWALLEKIKSRESSDSENLSKEKIY
ncbi:MAG: hypothetical protein ACOCT9_00690 [archaeon]